MENELFSTACSLDNRLPVGGKYTNSVLHFDVDATRYFERIDINSLYLRDLILRTIWKIIHSGFRSNLCFGSLIEGQTVAGDIAEVTADHCIRIDSCRLKQYKDSIAMAILAHELAHYHLNHFRNREKFLDNEHKADNLAKEWGFDIDRFRKIFGPPGINSRLLQITIINKTCLHGMSQSILMKKEN